jgi:2'-5' RNA ligase
MQDKKIRAFFAIDLPQELKQEMANTIKLLQQKNPSENIVWTKPENLHITLKFLGNILPSQYEQFLPAIKNAISQMQKFTVKLTEINLFPSKRSPRVIALLPSPMERLVVLACKIEEQVVRYGVQAETRAFKPHLTLARIKRKSKNEFNNIAMSPLTFEVERVALFRSEITHAGPKYEILQHISLR